MENDIWVRCCNNQARFGCWKNSWQKEIRWKVEFFLYEKLYTTEGYEPLIGIAQYYKDDDGEWKRQDFGFYYITLKMLLTDFILIDNPFDKELNKLTEQLADIWKNNLENTFKINGTLGDPIKPEDIGVEVIPQAEECNINDGE